MINICNNCEIEFDVKFAKRTQKFCSDNCYKQYRKSHKNKHIRICSNCNSTFVLKNITEERRYGWGKFCSRKCSKYNFDENYFKEIDSCEKAYWLGMLFADGNVYKNNLTLKLMLSDIDHLSKFKNALKSEHPFYLAKNCASFVINNTKLCGDLISHGVIPRKSLIITYPKLEKKYNRDFIRGYFDGDGCISYMHQNSKYKRISIFSGSEKFINMMKKILEDETDIKFSEKKYKVGAILYTAKRSNIEKLFHYFYDNSNIHLERKYEKFTQQ